jgi:hypothetical protein
LGIFRGLYFKINGRLSVHVVFSYCLVWLRTRSLLAGRNHYIGKTQQNFANNQHQRFKRESNNGTTRPGAVADEPLQ